MKKQFLGIFFAISIFFYSFNGQLMTQNTQTTGSDKAALDKLLEDYYQENLRLFPVTATMIGDNRYNDYWPNYISQEMISRLRDYHSKYKEELSRINRDNLPEKDKLNYDVIAWECEIGLEGLKFKDYLIPINQIFSQHLFIPQMANGTGAQPFASVQDHDNWLKRFGDYLDWCDTAIVNMRIGMKEGIVLPKSLIIKTIPQFEDFSKGPAEEHEFYTPVKNFPESFTQPEKERLTAAYKDIIDGRVIPLYKEMTHFLKTEYLPAGRETSGVGDTPLGKEYYAFCVKLNTTTNLTPDEIYETGLSEVDRIVREMETAKHETGFKGTLKEFFDYVRNNKELMPFTDPQQVLDRFNSIHEKMKPGLSKLFSREPYIPLKIERMPEYLEASSQAYYIAGTEDGSRPGTFYVPIPKVTEYNIYADEVLFLHECVPGHHYQADWQTRDTNLPAIRQLVWYVGMGEGWALYTESLGKELGLYTDPYQYFGMLSFEMLRATRLVLDVGLHVKGWSREKGIQYMKDLTPISEHLIESSIERYMASPGQALGYKIGQLKIMELRKKAERELGAEFNIAEFHEEVLSAGCVPLHILENKINVWMLSKKN